VREKLLKIPAAHQPGVPGVKRLLVPHGQPVTSERDGDMHAALLTNPSLLVGFSKQLSSRENFPHCPQQNKMVSRGKVKQEWPKRCELS
jgi:hypothetical protein